MAEYIPRVHTHAAKSWLWKSYSELPFAMILETRYIHLSKHFLIRNGYLWRFQDIYRRGIYPGFISLWWRHQMETFSALLALCAGNSPVTGEFTSQRPITRSFGVSLICASNKRLSKQSWGWWFETPSRFLWRHCTILVQFCSIMRKSVASRGGTCQIGWLRHDYVITPRRVL